MCVCFFFFFSFFFFVCVCVLKVSFFRVQVFKGWCSFKASVLRGLRVFRVSGL